MFASDTINEVPKNIQSNLDVKKFAGTPKKSLEFPKILRNFQESPGCSYNRLLGPFPNKIEQKSLLKPFGRVPVVLCLGALASPEDFCQILRGEGPKCLL